MNLDAYLDRVQYTGSRDPSHDTLRRLHEAHLAAIPFENLDILLGRSIRLELDALEEKLVTGRRGGYCFEQNTLFRGMLEALGFRVTSLAARVRTGSTAVRPRTHMLLRVEVGDASFVADVGFGGDGPRHPLPLEEAASSGHQHHRLIQEEDNWVLQGETDGHWTDLYAFTLEPHYPVDFEMASHFTSTYPHSVFVQSLTAQRILRERRIILRNRELVVRSAEGVTTSTVRDPEHLLATLREQFELEFPPGTRFSKPDFEP